MPWNRAASGASARTAHPDRPTATPAWQTCELALSVSNDGGPPAGTVDVAGTGGEIRRLAANPAEKTRRGTMAHNTLHRTDRSKMSASDRKSTRLNSSHVEISY